MKKALIIFFILAAVFAAGYLGYNAFKRYKTGGTIDIFSNVQWNNPVSLDTSNVFENLKLNPFEK